MMRNGMIVVIALALALPVLAQDDTIGVLVGSSEFLEGGLSFDLGADVQEFWYSRELDLGTVIRLKLGQADFEVEEEDSELPPGKYGVEYALALVEYRFDEVFGSTTIFLGPGAYRQDVGENEETNFGLSAGVTADFPVTRRFGLLLEGAYHWVNFDEKYEFLTLGGGFRFNF